MHLNSAIGNLHTITKEMPVLTQTHSLWLLTREFLGSCYRRNFHIGSETENRIHTVTSAPLAELEILQFLKDYKLGIKMDFKYTVQLFTNEQDIHLRIPAWN